MAKDVAIQSSDQLEASASTIDSPGVKYLTYIDAIRGLAILLVIFFHVSAVINPSGLFGHISLVGRYGVQLFFIASALTLFLSYSERSIRDGRYVKRNFFIRRIARIVPAFYAATAISWLMYVFYPYFFSWEQIVPWRVLVNCLFINSLFPNTMNHIPHGSWSVSVEMIFYCLVPLFFRKITSLKQALRYVIVASIGSQILNALVRMVMMYGLKHEVAGGWYLYFWFPNQLPIFLLGIMLFFLLKEKKVSSRLQKMSLFFSGILVIISFIIRYFFETKNYIPEHIIIGIFFVALIYYLANNSCWMLNNRIMRFFGTISFSLFLLHYLVLRITFGFVLALPFPPLVQVGVLFFITVALSSVLSVVSYRFIERPGIRFGSYVIKKITPPIL